MSAARQQSAVGVPDEPSGAPESAPGSAPGSAPESAPARLRDAAIRAFAARGFHGTTTRDIAAAAGMSPAALYVHHRSKEELLHLIARAGHEDFLRVLDEAIGSREDPVSRLHAAVRATVRHHAIHHTTARVTNDELAALADDHRAEVLAMRRLIESRLQEVVEAGVCAGVLRTDSPRMATVLVLSMVVDVTRWYAESGDRSPDELADFYADHVLSMLGAAR